VPAEILDLQGFQFSYDSKTFDIPALRLKTQLDRNHDQNRESLWLPGGLLIESKTLA
jgi:hypothetical protein